MDLSSTTASAMIAKGFPGVKVNAVERLEGGTISDVFRVSCRSPDVTLIVKMYPDNLHWKMQKEVFVYGMLSSNTDIVVPRIVVADDSKSLASQNYVVMTAIDGQMLRDVASTFTENDIAAVYQEMGVALRKMHDIHFDSFGYISTEVTDSKSTNGEYMRGKFASHLEQFRKLGGDPVVHAAVDKYLRAHEHVLDSCQIASLCHNDFHDANVIVGEDKRMSAVLDVENAVAGDPMLDIAKTDLYPSEGTGSKLKALLEGYGDVPDDWQERMQLYKIYHSLELWNWMTVIDPSTPWLSGVSDGMLQLASETALPFGI